MIKIWQSPNEIGDSFGIVNALFSGLAFAMLIYTSWMQRKELQMQRKELKLSRREMAQATEAHRKHVELVELQIENQRHQYLAQHKPNLKVNYSGSGLNITEGKAHLTIGLFTPINDCFLNEILILAPEKSPNLVIPKLYNNLIINKRTGAGKQISLNVDFYEKIVGVFINYADTQGNKYHQKLQVDLDHGKLNRKSTELRGHINLIKPDSNESYEEEVIFL
ncbi:MAG: hypothetical protein RIC32_18235 [Ekhidna sp.]